MTLQIAADILRDGYSNTMAYAPSELVGALWTLKAAVTGRRTGTRLNGAERLEALELAGSLLRTAIHRYQPTDDGEQWLEVNYSAPMLRKQADLEFIIAKERVESSVVTSSGRVYDTTDDGDPHAAGAALHAEMPKLLAMLAQANEWEIGRREIAVELAKTGHAHVHTLEQLRTFLAAADGFLLLSDAEFREHLQHASLGSLSGIRTYSELVAAVVELGGATASASLKAFAVVAKARNLENAAALGALSTTVATKASTAITVIETVSGFLAMIDSSATRQEQLDGGVSFATGTGWLVGTSKSALALSPKLAVAGPASVALSLTYGELKLVTELFGKASVGLVTGLMRYALERLQMHMLGIAQQYELVKKAQMLAASETDAVQRHALERVLASKADGLGTAIDGLIADLEPAQVEAGMARKPGAYQILREALADVLPFQGARSPEAVMNAASIAVNRLTWVLLHGQELAYAATKNEGMKEAEAYARAGEEGHR